MPEPGQPDSRGRYAPAYDTNKARVHGPELCCGQRRRPDAANASCLSIPVPAAALAHSHVIISPSPEACSYRASAPAGRRGPARGASCQRATAVPRSPCSLRSRGNVACRRRTCRAVASGWGCRPEAEGSVSDEGGSRPARPGMVCIGRDTGQGRRLRSIGVTGTTTVVQLLSCNNFDSNSARNRIDQQQCRSGRMVSDGGEKRRRRPWSRDIYLHQSESLF